MKKGDRWILVVTVLSACCMLIAQNPLIMDQFTADPSARVFGGRVYVYPSHDLDCGTNWFCMQDYHVFSSADMVNWIDHGVIIRQEEVAWVDANTNSLWAPDCYEKDGKYYFYFPAIADTNTGIKGMAIGVAISDKPYGPFTPQSRPIEGVSGIDPNVFIDKNGQAYLYWARMSGLYGVKLKDNMLELAGKPQPIESLPQGMKEGPFMFERKGIYYFTFPHVIDTTEALVYAMGSDPLGPFEYKGIFMDESPTFCWTNHHSIIEYEGQWYLFYHHNDLSPQFDKNRSVRVDSLFFNEDGTIRKVKPTLRGVGVVQATDKIEFDRYSAISQEGVSIEFLDNADRFAGWKSILTEENAWIRFNSVYFKEENLKRIKIKALSDTGGTVAIQIGDGDKYKIWNLKIPISKDWKIISANIKNLLVGIQNIEISLRDSGRVEIDWIQFE
ncbi:MAG: family 43 glycosylhydrolase [Candidatus Marinimicrobia bacterium]|nr:family 43 glycosylhydrolase [Candidatus Neomarinimicrobiota bacterium]